MHPVNAMFEEIYRDHWGIPQTKGARERDAHESLFRQRFARDGDRQVSRLPL